VPKACRFERLAAMTSFLIAIFISLGALASALIVRAIRRRRPPPIILRVGTAIIPDAREVADAKILRVPGLNAAAPIERAANGSGTHPRAKPFRDPVTGVSRGAGNEQEGETPQGNYARGTQHSESESESNNTHGARAEILLPPLIIDLPPSPVPPGIAIEAPPEAEAKAQEAETANSLLLVGAPPPEPSGPIDEAPIATIPKRAEPGRLIGSYETAVQEPAVESQVLAGFAIADPASPDVASASSGNAGAIIHESNVASAALAPHPMALKSPADAVATEAGSVSQHEPPHGGFVDERAKDRQNNLAASQGPARHAGGAPEVLPSGQAPYEHQAKAPNFDLLAARDSSGGPEINLEQVALPSEPAASSLPEGAHSPSAKHDRASKAASTAAKSAAVAPPAMTTCDSDAETVNRVRETPEHDRSEKSAEPLAISADSSLDMPLQPEPNPLPRQYRAQARGLSYPANPPSARTQMPGKRSLQIFIRIIFEHGDFCRISFLARRPAGYPAAIAVCGDAAPPELAALQGRWYQDCFVHDPGNVLRTGINWSATAPNGKAIAWALSGREIYVLAKHGELHGLVSVPRLEIGESHLILCTAQIEKEVREALALAGCGEPESCGADQGIPAGWICFRKAVPRLAVSPANDGNILDVLRPSAEAKIVFSDGIRIGRQAWLIGHPPRIECHGAPADAVVIDGMAARAEAGGGWISAGWDAAGEHWVSCSNRQRRYTIREGAEEWAPWDAYRFALSSTLSEKQAALPAICGSVIRSSHENLPQIPAVVVDAKNPLLLGPKPGDIYMCRVRTDIQSIHAIGFPAFSPVWALPAKPSQSRSQSAKAMRIGTAAPVRDAGHDGKSRFRGAALRTDAQMLEWCSAILAVCQKRLPCEPNDAFSAGLWNEYRELARLLWRQR
jgi:hypothetical protein